MEHEPFFACGGAHGAHSCIYVSTHTHFQYPNVDNSDKCTFEHKIHVRLV